MATEFIHTARNIEVLRQDPATAALFERRASSDRPHPVAGSSWK
jgi:hypothetical protein